MIDTIRVAYPPVKELVEYVKDRQSRLIRLSPDGSVLWQKGWMAGADLPSHFSGLWIGLIDGEGLRNQGFDGAKDMVQFEFSLAKWLSPSGYNNRNTDWNTDLSGFADWVSMLSNEIGVPLDVDAFTLYRCDVSQNFLLNGNVAVLDYIRSLKNARMSSHENGEYPEMRKGSIFYGSAWMSKKLYSKYLEFMEVERKKKRKVYSDDYITNGGGSMSTPVMLNGKKPLTALEIDGLARMVRFEIGFKRSYLDRHGIIRIGDTPQLMQRFDEECKRFMPCSLLRHSVSLTPSETLIIQSVIKQGYENTRNDYLANKTVQGWCKMYKKLMLKGIDLKCVVDESVMETIKETGQQLEYNFDLAA